MLFMHVLFLNNFSEPGKHELFLAIPEGLYGPHKTKEEYLKSAKNYHSLEK